MNDREFVKELNRYNDRDYTPELLVKYKAVIKCIDEHKISQPDFVDIVRALFCPHEMVGIKKSGENVCLRCKLINVFKPSKVKPKAEICR